MYEHTLDNLHLKMINNSQPPLDPPQDVFYVSICGLVRTKYRTTYMANDLIGLWNPFFQTISRRCCFPISLQRDFNWQMWQKTIMLYFLAFLLEVLDCGPKCKQHRNEYAKSSTTPPRIWYSAKKYDCQN